MIKPINCGNLKTMYGDMCYTIDVHDLLSNNVTLTLGDSSSKQAFTLTIDDLGFYFRCRDQSMGYKGDVCYGEGDIMREMHNAWTAFRKKQSKALFAEIHKMKTKHWIDRTVTQIRESKQRTNDLNKMLKTFRKRA